MRRALPETIELSGRSLPLCVRRHGRARRFSLKLDPLRERVVLVMPKRGRKKAAARFLYAHTGWLEARMAALPAPIPIEEGARLPIGDQTVTLRHDPTTRSAGWLEGDILTMGGAEEHLARRVRDFLKKHAKTVLRQDVEALCSALEIRVPKLSIRDTTSRWGSCSARGTLSFSWRLVLAPRFVREYLVAHEVAHLKEGNHAPAFYELLDQLCPHREAAERWLKENRLYLMRVL